jgi:hypothetical protein
MDPLHYNALFIGADPDPVAYMCPSLELTNQFHRNSVR